MGSTETVPGQFYTEQSELIFQGMDIPAHSNYIEPFAGAGHLTKWIQLRFPEANVIQYDICPNADNVIRRDTLLDPPDYTGTYVVTNPPYVARNKCNDKTIFDMYQCNDLYKCFIRCLVNTPPDGGVLILPVNFLTGMRKSDCEMRREFFSIFKCIRINIFTKPVFSITTSAILSIQFEKSSESTFKLPINMVFENRKLNITLSEQNRYTIGGEYYQLPQHPDITIHRLRKTHTSSDASHLTVYIMDSPQTQDIRMTYGESPYFGLDTDRSKLTLVFSEHISDEIQQCICEEFNTWIKHARTQYESLFLPSFREYGRKRIPFNLVYRVVGWILLHHVI